MSNKNHKLIRKFALLTANPAAPALDYNYGHMLTKAYITGRFNDEGEPITGYYQIESTRTVSPHCVRAVVKTTKKLLKRGEITLGEIKQVVEEAEANAA